MDIINRILKLSKEKGIKEQDLCRFLGLSNSGIYHWKNGKGEPSATQIIKLAECLEVSENYLLKGEDLQENNIEDELLKIPSIFREVGLELAGDKGEYWEQSELNSIAEYIRSVKEQRKK